MVTGPHSAAASVAVFRLLSSDSHSVDTLDFGFEEAKLYLRDIGFRYAFALIDNRFKRYEI